MLDTFAEDSTSFETTTAIIPAISRGIARSLDVIARPVRSSSAALAAYAPRSFAELLPSTGHDWTAEKVPLYTGDSIAVPGAFAVVRSDSRAPLGVVGSRYTITQPRDLASSLDEFFAGMPLVLESALTVRGGAQLAFEAALPEQFSLRLFQGRDVTRARLIFRTSFDGSTKTEGFLMGKRLVCSNGLRIDSVIPGTTWTTKHTRNADRRREAAVRQMRDWASQWRVFQEAAEHLAARQLSATHVRSVVEQIVLEPDEIIPGEAPKATRGQERTIETITALVDDGLGADIPGVRGTAWSVFQAVTEFSNHYAPARGSLDVQAERRIERVLDGDALARRAFAVLTRV